jgi:type I restriction enzyme R subunit
VAFTATPKAKTLELFGRRPNPKEPAGPGNLPAPFHVYSMRQAIEEGFILDVLQNYTSYKLAFQLAQEGQSLSSEEVERNAALKKLMGWVKLHPHNIARKVEIVVEHFRQFVWPLLDGKAKAMVVVGSRKEAVRWKLAIDQYIQEQGYPLGTLVAFSGEVNDAESGPMASASAVPTSTPTSRATSAKPSRARVTRSCWWPISFRPASTSRCFAVCMWTGASMASRRYKPSRA